MSRRKAMHTAQDASRCLPEAAQIGLTSPFSVLSEIENSGLSHLRRTRALGSKKLGTSPRLSPYPLGYFDSKLVLLGNKLAGLSTSPTHKSFAVNEFSASRFDLKKLGIVNY